MCAILAAASSLILDANADPAKILTGAEKTEHFELRYRPGSRAGSGVDRLRVHAERDLSQICSLLEVKPEGSFILFLYDDVAELSQITRTEGNAGFSSENASHVPFDNDQTRFHELVHIVAYRLPKSGDEPRNLFFAEGLANALLEFVDGVHVHAEAAFERKRGKLPRLEEMTGAADFYQWLRAHSELSVYNIAASYFRFLIDSYGVAQVKKYYTGLPASKSFGAAAAEIEKGWHGFLDGYALRPEVETALRRRRGEAAKFTVLDANPDRRLPAELLGKPEDWTALTAAKFAAGRDEDWKREGGGIRGTSGTPDWSVCSLGDGEFGDCAVRAKIRVEPGCVGVQIRLGADCQAMVTEAGTFVWRETVTAAERAEPLSGRKELDLLLERRGDRVAIWIDGFKVVEGPAGSDPSRVGLGVAGGTATFESVRVRRFK